MGRARLDLDRRGEIAALILAAISGGTAGTLGTLLIVSQVHISGGTVTAVQAIVGLAVILSGIVGSFLGLRNQFSSYVTSNNLRMTMLEDRVHRIDDVDGTFKGRHRTRNIVTAINLAAATNNFPELKHLAWKAVDDTGEHN